MSRADATFDLLNTLCAEPLVRQRLVGQVLLSRTAGFLYTCLDQLCAPDKADGLKVRGGGGRERTK